MTTISMAHSDARVRSSQAAAAAITGPRQGGSMKRKSVVGAMVACLLLGSACSAQTGQSGENHAGANGTGSDANRDIRRLGHVSYDFQGEQRQWPTIAGTVRDKPRSSASLKKSAMNPQIEIKAYQSGAFRGETFEITLMYPSPTREPDFRRPSLVKVTYRPGSVLDPFWSGRNGRASIESVVPEGDGAHVKGTFTTELCRKEKNSAPVDEASCFQTQGVIDTTLVTPDRG